MPIVRHSPTCPPWPLFWIFLFAPSPAKSPLIFPTLHVYISQFSNQHDEVIIWFVTFSFGIFCQLFQANAIITILRQMVELEPCCSSYSYCSTFDLSSVGTIRRHGQQPPAESDRQKTRKTFVPKSSPIGSSNLPLGKHCSQILMLMITVIVLITQNGGAMALNTAKCYSFSSGLTIPGADFRRDYGLSRRECAEVCKSDLCCMAFEWRRDGGQCTLKSRSLNGTVTAATANLAWHKDEGERRSQTTTKTAYKREENGGGDRTDIDDLPYFALCLDYGDSDRDRFWDHELFGPVVASAEAIERDKCAELCGDFAMPVTGGKRYRRTERTKLTPLDKRSGSAVIYSWRSHNPSDMEMQLGECQCISVLQHIRISFGSFAGFLI